MMQGKVDRWPARGGICSAGLPIILGLLAACAPLWAAGSKEQDLRARVEQLYSAIQRSDWPRAEKYLTKESRPIFRNGPKQAISGYQIQSIKVDAGGESATVVVGVPTAMVMMPVHSMAVPQTTRWRRVKGRWYLELAQSGAGRSPFNHLAQEQPSTPRPSIHPKDLKFKSTWATVGYVHKGETKVAQFTFTNVSQRVVTLANVQTDCPCMQLKSQQKEFKPGEAGVLEFELDPSSFSFESRTALTLTASFETEPEHARNQLTVAAVLVPDSDQRSAPKH